MVWFLGKFEKLIGKNLFLIGKILELFVKPWYDFLEKFVVGKIWNWWIWISILKFLFGKILLGIFLPKLVGKILCAMLGVFFENVPVGKLVWNIGKIFETLTWENFCLGTLVNLLKVLSWEHLMKVGKIFIWENFVSNLEFLFGKRLLLSMFVEQNLWKFTWEIFVSLTWEFLFGKNLKILLGKTLFPSSQHGGLTDGQLVWKKTPKVTLLMALFCSLVTLSHPVWKICFMKASLIVSLWWT